MTENRMQQYLVDDQPKNRRRIRGRDVVLVSFIGTAIVVWHALLIAWIGGWSTTGLAIAALATLPFLVPVVLIVAACRHDAALQAGKATAPGTRPCRACGHPVIITQRVCPECGTQMVDPGPDLDSVRMVS